MEHNWSGNIEYSARRIERPASLGELRAVVRRSRQVRVVGTWHSFNRIVDADVLVSLDSLARGVEVDTAGRTVECDAATTYGALAAALHRHGLALHNLASLPHISCSLTGSKDREVMAGRVIAQVGADPLRDRVEERFTH